MKQRNADNVIFLILVLILLCLFLANIVFMIIVFQKNTDYEYAAFIKNRLFVSCVPMMGMGVSILFFGVIFFKKMGRELIENWMVIVWFVISVLLSVYIVGVISIHYMDIKYEDHIEYNGEFKKDHTRDFIFLNDEKSTRLTNTSDTFLETGQYFGTIIYSGRCKYVLYCSINNEESGSGTTDQQ